jgi:hypothetical protein
MTYANGRPELTPIVREFVISEVSKTNPKAARAMSDSLNLLEPSTPEEIKKSEFVERVK